MEAARALFKYGANIHITGKDSEKALFMAVRLNLDVSILRELIEMDIDPLARNAADAVAMHLAFFQNVTSITINNIKYLMEEGIDIDSVDNDGRSLCHYYAEGLNEIEYVGNEYITNFLLHNVSLDINQENANKESSLLVSVKGQNLDAGYFLIACGV
ncbi:MAG: hypothetical protein AB8U25_00700 [Rickettsiales endosymbiont of Dermacentor nuttalli]